MDLITSILTFVSYLGIGALVVGMLLLFSAIALYYSVIFQVEATRDLSIVGKLISFKAIWPIFSGDGLSTEGKFLRKRCFIFIRNGLILGVVGTAMLIFSVVPLELLR